MNDRTRNIELAALAAATDTNGNVDLTRFEAQRLILANQSIDGIDANAVVRQIIASPSFARPGGPEQAQPLLDAIRGSLSPAERDRFNTAVDASNQWDTWTERAAETVGGVASDAYTAARDGVVSLDNRITRALGDYRQWADRARANPENSFLETAAADLAARGIGTAQENYGRLRGVTGGALNMIGETVDLAQFGAKFATDSDFRNLMIGAAAVYANDVREGRRNPVDDITGAARGAWNNWQQGLEEAQRNGTADQYLGTTQGQVGVELLAAIVPVSKLTKFARLARAMDVDAPDGPSAGAVGREAAQETSELLDDLARGARAAQQHADPTIANAGNLFFSGLAGVRRSQGELRSLVDEMKATNNLDGLLASGALRPNELSYLARTDLAVFNGQVSFDQAISAYVGNRALTSLSTREIGDIGEAITAHDLARRGYRDIVPIQNNSGHGNDLVATHPETGRQEVIEVKASVHGRARQQSGDPERLIAGRLNRAVLEEGHWAPHNMWEEQAFGAAQRILREHLGPDGRSLDIDAKWSRVNLERDASGVIRGTPEIEPWRAPQQQVPKPTQRTEALSGDTPTSAFTLPADFRSPAHPGRPAFEQALAEVHRMEASNRIASGPNSERLAGAVAVTVEQENLRLHHLELGKDGKVQAVEIGPYPEFQRRSVAIDSAKAIATPLEQSAADWAQLRSPHYRSQEAPTLRTGEQASLLSQLSPEDARLFSKIRDSVPGQVPDEQIALATLRAKQAGITDESKLQTATLAGDSLWLVGNTPGFRERINLSEQAPTLQDTVQQTQTFNAQQQELQLAQEMEQRQQAQGRSMSV